MRKRLLRCFIRALPALVLAVLVAAPVYAAITYEADITLEETNGTSYTMLGVRHGLDVATLESENYITSTGLDTRVEKGTAEYPHMLTDDKLMFADAVVGNSTQTYDFTTNNSALSQFYVIPGYGGYITVNDTAALEPGNNFEFEFDGYIDTAAGSNKNLVYKEDACQTYVSGATNITSRMWGLYSGTPVVEATSKGTGTTVTFPSGVQAGDLLVLFLSADAGIATPADWTSLFQDSSGGNTWFGGFYRVADGGEGPSMEVDADVEAYTCYRISAYSGTPEAGVATKGEPSANPDPPSLTPTWGAGGDTLWLAAEGSNGETVSAYPANYTNGLAEAGIASAQRVLDAVSEDPGVFTLIARFWVANTVAVRAGGGWAATVTAAGVSSGEHKVKVTADGTNLKIYIDDVEEDSVALAGASVPGNSNNWTLIQNNVVPYMGFYKHTVSSTLIAHYQPVDIISGTVLPDREGAAQNGAFTWGTNPGGVSVSMGSLLPPTSDPAGEEELPAPGVVGEVNPPTGWLFPDEASMGAGSVLRPLVQELSEMAHTPVWMAWWYIYGFIAILALALTFKLLHHLWMAGIAAVVVSGLFYTMNVVPWWFILIGVIGVVGAAVMERTPAL